MVLSQNWGPHIPMDDNHVHHFSDYNGSNRVVSPCFQTTPSYWLHKLHELCTDLVDELIPIWLVVWNIFFHISGIIIIPTDFHSMIFQRGRLKPWYTTNQFAIFDDEIPRSSDNQFAALFHRHQL